MGLFGPPNVEKMKAKKDVKGLIKALAYQKDKDVRRAAAEALGQIGDDRAVEPLIAALKDEDSYVRKDAAQALGQIGDACAVEPLIAVLQDGTWDARVAAAHALEQLGWEPDWGETGAWYWITKGNWEMTIELGGPAVGPLIATLTLGDTNAREAAIRALGNIGDPRAVEPLIVALEDRHSSVRMAAATALGSIGDPRAIEPLIAGFKDNYVRRPAVQALGEIGASAVKLLIVALEDKSPLVRSSAAKALAEIGNAAVRPLVTALTAGGEKREVASQALIKMGSPAVQPLIDVLDDKRAVVRKVAAEVLGEIGDRQAVEPLISALKDKNDATRVAAARALGRISAPQAVEPLIAALDDRYYAVRQAAAEALGQIGDPEAIEPLTAALKDRSDDVRKAVSVTLGKLGWKPDHGETGAWYCVAMRNWSKARDLGAPAIAPLISALRKRASMGFSGDYLAIAEALARVDDPEAVEPLIAALKNEEWYVREVAARALGEIGDPDAAEPLIAALRHKEVQVRRAAADALVRMYHEGNLNQQAQKSILAVRTAIIQTHDDQVACYAGEYFHSDNMGIGVEFPL